MKRRNAGFTLVEMMVVVVIISILVGLVLVMVDPTPTPRDVSQRVADLVRETNREAIQYGQIRTNVVAANGLTKARACIVGSTNAAGQTVFTTNLLVEATPVTSTSYAWVPEQSYTVPRTVSSYAFATSVGNLAGVTAQTTWTSFKLCCYPDGTCDPYSVFFQNTRGGQGGLNYQARVSLLPLGAMPVIRTDFTSL